MDAIPSLLIPVLVLGSIYGGICTPTEAAAFACFVGIIISCFVYKEVKISELPYLGFRAVMLCTPVLFVIGMSSGFGKVLAIADIPTMIAEAILGLTTNKILLLLLINILLLFVGAFMETNAAIIILTPILLPIVKAVGVSPVHFGMIMYSVQRKAEPTCLNVLCSVSVSSSAYIMQGISHPGRRNTGIVSRTGRMVNRYSKNQSILPSIFSRKRSLPTTE